MRAGCGDKNHRLHLVPHLLQMPVVQVTMMGQWREGLIWLRRDCLTHHSSRQHDTETEEGLCMGAEASPGVACERSSERREVLTT